eukprot:GO255640.1.p1 GENE.GO255640.1~~GO255640.1.p1  ORF type:complete len:176 (+),score=22.00 GO255640.1:38-529(+)
MPSTPSSNCPLSICFALPLLSLVSSSQPSRKVPSRTQTRRRQHRPPATLIPTSDSPTLSPRLQQTRLRLHLLQLERQHRRNATTAQTDQPTEEPIHTSDDISDISLNPSGPDLSKRLIRSSYSTDERRARSERLRAKWQDPEWRAAMLEKRRSKMRWRSAVNF